ncbi:METL4 protein, partial [Atlantisia rogersi]|nr:METL4 protein [Atlantisia rogersi]
MSVVQRLAAGWLVDHLSFINQCGYEVCHPFVRPGSVALHTRVTSTGGHPVSTSAAPSSSRDSPISGPGEAIETEGKMAKSRYVFREEFFDVSKPHIAGAPQEQLCQECPGMSLCEVCLSILFFFSSWSDTNWCWDFLLILQRRKRKCVLNQGERDALEYHSKIRERIWEGAWHLVQEGLKSGFLHRPTAELSCQKNVVPGHIGCGLAELCEMAKQFPAVIEGSQQAVRVLHENTPIPEQDLLLRVIENSSNCAKIVMLMGQKYLVPPKSSFLLSDISCLQPLLDCK